MKNILEVLSQTKAFAFDIDGVLTDSFLQIDADGNLLRRMNIKDGYALQLAVKKGYPIWIISGGKSEPAKLRLQNLGIEEVHIGVANKIEVFQSLILKYNVSPDTVLYMGDDMPDIAPLKYAGIAACPKDAVSDIQSICTYVSPFAGGHGCVRDVIEKVMKLHGKWE